MLLVLHFIGKSEASIDYALVKHNGKCLSILDTFKCTCHEPMYCDQPTLLSGGYCKGCADLNESGFWTDCCNHEKYYNDGCLCREIPAPNVEPYFCPSSEIDCKVQHATCGFYNCEKDGNVRWVDDCCYPMVCKTIGVGGDEDVNPDSMPACVGTSGLWSQCSTTDCSAGLICNKFKQCVPCKEAGYSCDITQGNYECCDALECVYNPYSSNWACNKCRTLGSECYPESYNYCCDNNFCIIENVGEVGHCKDCALTGQSDEDCCYSRSKNYYSNTCYGVKCINTFHNQTCAGQYQICTSQTGYMVNCCEGLECQGTGICSG